MKAKTNNETSEPQLDQPGAGLPVVERFIAKRMVAAKYRKADREEIAADLERERKRIIALAVGVSPDQGTTPVLVKRQRGMEDSSRYWSVYMVLDHLRIVNGEVASFIELLGIGEIPTEEADTAKVKPAGEVAAEVIDRFDASCRRVAEVVAAIETLETEVTHPHPWFGPFDAGQWHHMVAFHMTLHRRQIQEILKDLR